MYKVSITYFFDTDEEFAEIEKIVWGDPDKNYEDGLDEISCGGHKGGNEKCRVDDVFGTRVLSSGETEKYMACKCKCCGH